jgi:S1-C subfamily serine protease
MSKAVGGTRDGASFESPFAATPLTGLAYERGSWSGEPGFARIEPVDPRSQSWGLEIVVAKPGYAIGGIKVDSGQVFHAMQVVFMRIRPDGRLDPQDTYTSDWIGEPKGGVQTVVSEGTPVVGVHGRRMLLVHAIGLIFSSSAETAVAASEPSTAPTAATPPSPPADSASLSRAATAALNSVVLVEHPLASGSGFVVAKNIVATNAHVVDGAFPDEINVQFGAENTPPCRVSQILHFDRMRDLCLLEVDVGLPPLPIRGDYLLHPGDPVVLVGNPSVKGGMLLRNAVNQGKLVTVMRVDGQDVYQIDVTVNPGWSGGPVLDAEGKVIAVVAMKVNDESVAEVRTALERLDDNYRARAGNGTATGITLSIPASALAKALEAPNLHDEQRLAPLNDRYAAQATFERLNFLTNLTMLRMQINVPYQVRLEAQAFEQAGGVSKTRVSRLAGTRVEYIRLMPAEVATRLSQALKSPDVRVMEERFTEGLDARLDAVFESPHVRDEVKRDLRSLARKIKEAGQYAERPAAGYAAFSLKVKGFSRDFKDLLKRVESGVEDKTP